MLRRLRVPFLAALAAVALAGCVTVAATPSPAPVTTTGGQIVAQVQSLTVKACGFLPAASSVVNLFTAGQYATALELASAVCAAVATPRVTFASGHAKRSPPVLHGIVIKGNFVT